MPWDDIASLASSEATSASALRAGATNWTVSKVRRPWAAAITVSGSRLCRVAQLRHVRSTSSAESTRTPSRSNRMALHQNLIAADLMSSFAEADATGFQL